MFPIAPALDLAVEGPWRLGDELVFDNGLRGLFAPKGEAASY
jgi:hypothetical protein